MSVKKANALSIPPGEYGRKAKTQGIDGDPHKRRSMWFNSTISEEPYLGSKCSCKPMETLAAFEGAI